MSATQLNDSLFNNISTKCMPDLRLVTDASRSIVSIALLGNFAVGVPANMWMSWLICHGTKELLASDIYLLSLAFCEIIYCLGLPAQLYCMYGFERVIDGLPLLLNVQMFLVWTGRPIFQSCICVERYIAVVHPLTFIRLKPLKYTVTQCALAWCFVFFVVLLMLQIPWIGMLWFVPTFCTFLYCYFAVLFSLKRPGPGERRGEERGRGDKMKRRAINIILVNMVCYVVNYLPPITISFFMWLVTVPAIVYDLAVSLGVLCGLVQPLLYLHRAGKLTQNLKGNSTNPTN